MIKLQKKLIINNDKKEISKKRWPRRKKRGNHAYIK